MKSIKSVFDSLKLKRTGSRLSMVTCYDYTSARILSGTSVDALLVGDSLAMTMHGFDSTLPATPEMMALHVSAVRRGSGEIPIVADLPFLAHRGSLDRTLDAVRLVMQAGAQAVKIEGVDGSESVLHHIVESGVPLMGHLGLTPQSFNELGGYKIQGTNREAAENLKRQALAVQKAGAFALVLECVPDLLAKEITESLRIPTIGIGAGAACSGQILVWQDMLGLNQDFKAKFVRHFASGAQIFRDALNQYDREVKAGTFPNVSESYQVIEPKASPEVSQ